MLIALLAAVALAATPQSQQITYALRIGERTVGQRQVTIRYLPPDEWSDTETRIIESFESIDAEIAGRRVHHEERITARAADGRSSFTAALSDNGKNRELQGRMHSDGHWTVTELGGGERKTWTYRRTEVGLSSMDLLDPQRHALLTDHPTASVLSAESGAILTGAVEDLGEASITIAGHTVPVRRQRWSPGGAEIDLSYTLDGLLLAYELDFMGQRMQARAKQVPEARNFGVVQIPSQFNDAKVFEEDL